MAFTTVSTGVLERVRTALAMAIASTLQTYAPEAAEKPVFLAGNQLARSIVQDCAQMLNCPVPAAQNLVAVLTSAARTSTTDSGDQTNTLARGVLVVLQLTAFTTAASLICKIQLKNAAGAYSDICVAPAALTAVGSQVLILDPKVGTTLAGVDVCTDGILPNQWRVEVVHGNGNSHTYSVSAYPIR